MVQTQRSESVFGGAGYAYVNQKDDEHLTPLCYGRYVGLGEGPEPNDVGNSWLEKGATMNGLRKSEFIGSPMGVKYRRDATAICFLGSGQQFSETVLRTVDAEMAPTSSLRLSDLDALQQQLEPEGRLEGKGQLCTLVSDESNAEGLIALSQDPEGGLGRARLAIAYEDESFGRALMERYGAHIISRQISLLPMNLNLTTWLLIVRMVVSGGHYIAPALARSRPMLSAINGFSAMPGGDAIDNPQPLTALTPREAEVLGMLASGQPNKIIAGQLNLSEHTVKLHIHRIIGKLGVSNRTEAAIWFHRHGGH